MKQLYSNKDLLKKKTETGSHGVFNQKIAKIFHLHYLMSQKMHEHRIQGEAAPQGAQPPDSVTGALTAASRRAQGLNLGATTDRATSKIDIRCNRLKDNKGTRCVTWIHGKNVKSHFQICVNIPGVIWSENLLQYSVR